MRREIDTPTIRASSLIVAKQTKITSFQCETGVQR